MDMKFSIATAAVWLLSGCVTSPVLILDGGNYLVTKHTAFPLMTPSTLIEKTAIEAQDYCAKESKNALIKSSLVTGIQGLTSQSANVVFSCVTPDSAAVAGGH